MDHKTRLQSLGLLVPKKPTALPSPELPLKLPPKMPLGKVYKINTNHYQKPLALTILMLIGIVSGVLSIQSMRFLNNTQAFLPIANPVLPTLSPRLIPPTTLPPQAYSQISGDCNRDGQVTTKDLATLKLWVSDQKTLQPNSSNSTCDANQDGFITVADSQCLQQILQGDTCN